MRLLGTADLHGGLTRYGAPTASGGNTRVDDFSKSLKCFAQHAIEQQVDVAAFAGDTFNTRREGPLERAMFVNAVRTLTDHDIAVVVVPGNHDGMTTVGDSGSHALRWLMESRLPRVYTLLEPGTTVVETRHGDLSVTAMPYPHKRAFDTELAHLDPEDRVLEAGRRLDDAIATLGLHLSAPLPRLFIGHLTVGGASLGSESSMKFSWDVSITPGALRAWDFALLGHIHHQQRIAPNAWYAGSPEYLDFGDMGQRKGFLLVDFDRAQSPTVTVLDSRPRPMVEVPISLMEDGLDRYDADLIPAGAIVRATVKTDGKVNLARISGLVASMRGSPAASYVKLHVIAPEREVEQRIKVDATVDVLTATERWLTANGHPLQPTMDEARHLVATIGGTE